VLARGGLAANDDEGHARSADPIARGAPPGARAIVLARTVSPLTELDDRLLVAQRSVLGPCCARLASRPHPPRDRAAAVARIWRRAADAREPVARIIGAKDY